MSKIELIIFDMDGLMFDTESIAFLSWKEAAAGYGYNIDEGLFVRTIGSNFQRTSEIYLAHFGEDFPMDEVAKVRFQIAGDIVSEKGVTAKEGLYTLLEYLKEKNIKKVVATSTSRSRAYGLLNMAGIYSEFDYILCGDEVERGKPDPEIFLKVAEKFKCLPDTCLVLEDSEVGILAAHRAGMLPVMIPDMKEPEEGTKALAFRQLANLKEGIPLLEELLQEYREVEDERERI